MCVQLEAIAPEWGIGSQRLPHPKPAVSILVESTNCRLGGKKHSKYHCDVPALHCFLEFDRLTSKTLEKFTSPAVS